jgi:O-antigen/teichoic acid export membrane protein
VFDTLARAIPASLRQRLAGRTDLRQIAGNTGWLFAEQAIRTIIALTIGIAFTRYLGPDRFGVFSYAASVVTMVGVLARLGLDALVVRDIVREPGRAPTFLGTALALRLLGALLTAGLCLGIAQMLGDQPDLRRAVAIMSLTLVAAAFEVVNFWFQAEVQSKAAVVARSLGALLTGAAKLLLILANADLIWFVWLFVAEAALPTLAMLGAYQSRGGDIIAWRPDMSLARRYLRDSWPVMLSNAMVMLYLKIDVVMLGSLDSTAATGLYAAATRFSEIWYFIPMAISWSAFPMIIRAREASEEVYQRQVQLLYNAMVYLSLPIAVLMSLLARPLIHLLLGAPYAPSADILAVHVWAGVFTFLETVRGKVLITWKATRPYLYSTLMGVMTNIGLNLLLIPALSGLGAAIATLISYAVVTILSCFVIPGLHDEGMRILRALAAPVTDLAGLLRRMRGASR